MQQHLLAENYPGPARRADHQPGLRGPLDAGAGLARLPRADALLLADEPAVATRATRRRRPTRCSRRPPRGCRCGAATRRNPDNLCGQKVLAFGADRTELVPTANVACGLQPAQLWHPVDQPDRRALRHRRLHALGVRRHGHARRAERQGPAGGRQRRRAVRAASRCSAARSRPSSSSTSTPRSAGSTSTATSSPQRTDRRPGRRCGSSTRPAASTAPPARRTSPRSTTAPAARWTTRASIPAFHSFTYRARLDKANGNHDNQVIWLSRDRRRRCRTSSTLMRRVARHAASSRPRLRDACFMAGGVRGD